MKDSSKHDNFLADAVKPRAPHRLGYLDGFRFGVGFSIAGLFLILVLAGLTWGIIVVTGIH